MVGSAQGPLTRASRTLKADLLRIVRAGIDAASAGGAVTRFLTERSNRASLSAPIRVIAAGKAAASMTTALLADAAVQPRAVIAAGTHRTELPPQVEWFAASHPLPDERSVAAGRRALETARAARTDETLLLLLSGGASSVLALPIEEITLEDKRRTIELMMHSGADITALNTVRKHLSAIKGGRLAAACPGRTLTLAVSDVTTDDPTVIGSGPGVADATTWMDVAGSVETFGGAGHPPRVQSAIARGVDGSIADTPKSGDPRLARATAQIIAGRREALAGAERAARELGYAVIRFEDAIAGEARVAARVWFDRVAAAAAHAERPVCVLSAGETTVRVSGRGKGGRNQEFVLALMHLLGSGRQVTVDADGAIARGSSGHAVASVGTDGIDGPTDAAGAVADQTSRERAAERGLVADEYLADNNAYAYFEALGDLIRLGRTDTNVGDLQICLII